MSEVSPVSMRWPVSPAVSAARGRLGVTIAIHALVDFFAFLIVPLISVLEGRLQLSPQQGAAVIALGSVSSGLVQPAVAWASDRFDTRLFGVAGLLLAAVATCLVGYVETYGQLLAVQVAATAGIGAFHPVAAASVGYLAGARRSLLLAVFYTAGMVGGTVGNVTAPFYVRYFSLRGAGETPLAVDAGLRALVWLMVPGLVGVPMLAWAIRRVPHRHVTAHQRHRALDVLERRARWRTVGLLFAGNALRFIVNMALITLVIRWAEEAAMVAAGVEVMDAMVRSAASTLNGPMQGAMQVGMAVGAVATGLFVRADHEKAALVWAPLAGAVVIVLFPFLPALTGWLGVPGALRPMALVLAVAMGMGYGGMIPATIGLAQRMLPHRTSLASSLMMGAGWALAAVGPPMAQSLQSALGLAWAFAMVGGLLALSGLLALPLPGQALQASRDG